MLMIFLFLLGSAGNFFASESMAQPITEEISQQDTNRIVTEAIMPYFLALQTGDVQSLERYIGGKLEETLGKLLRQNPGYSGFLQERYGDTSLRDTIKILRERNPTGSQVDESRKMIAIIPIKSPKLGQTNLIIEIEKNAENLWKIVDQKVMD